MKTRIKNTCLFSLLLLGFMSCEKPPKFDFKPVIELNDLYHSKYFNAENEFFIDTFNVSIKFKDGDGDLGVEKSDVGNIKYRAYSDTIFDTLGMPESFIFRNYYLKMLRKEKGVYVEIPSTSNLNNTFDELISYEEVGPIEGVFNYGFSLVPVSLLSAGFKYNDTIKFEIYIMDRALNKSNTILSDSIIILKK